MLVPTALPLIAALVSYLLCTVAGFSTCKYMGILMQTRLHIETVSAAIFSWLSFTSFIVSNRCHLRNRLKLVSK